MDKVQIEIVKDEFIHQDEAKKKSIATSSIEKTNILNEKVHVLIDQGIILPLTEQETTSVKSGKIKMKMDSKTEVKQENFRKFETHEQVGIDLITSKDFETSVKPETKKNIIT